MGGTRIGQKPVSFPDDASRKTGTDKQTSKKNDAVTASADSVNAATQKSGSAVQANVRVPINDAWKNIFTVDVGRLVKNVERTGLQRLTITAEEMIDAIKFPKDNHGRVKFETTWGGHCFKFPLHKVVLSYSELVKLAMMAKPKNPEEQAELFKLIEELKPKESSWKEVEANFYGILLKIIHFFSSSNSMVSGDEMYQAIERSYVDRNPSKQEMPDYEMKELLFKSAEDPNEIDARKKEFQLLQKQIAENMIAGFKALGGETAVELLKEQIRKGGRKYQSETGEMRFSPDDAKQLIREVLSKLDLRSAEEMQLKALKQESTRKKDVDDFNSFEQRIDGLFKAANYQVATRAPSGDAPKLVRNSDLIGGIAREVRNSKFTDISDGNKLDKVLEKIIPERRARRIFENNILNLGSSYQEDASSILGYSEKLKKEDLKDLTREQLTLIKSIYDYAHQEYGRKDDRFLDNANLCETMLRTLEAQNKT